MAITHIKKHKLYYIIAIGILASVFLGYLLVYAINTKDEGWKINPGSSSCVVYHDPNSQGYENAKKVKNNLSLPIFVPTKTNQEWNSFVNNKPANIVITDGISVCGQNEGECIVGTPTGGYCDGYYRRWRCEDDCDQYYGGGGNANCSVQSQQCTQP